MMTGDEATRSLADALAGLSDREQEAFVDVLLSIKGNLVGMSNAESGAEAAPESAVAPLEVASP